MKITLSLIIALCFSTASFSQNPNIQKEQGHEKPNIEEMVEKTMSTLNAKLKLTEAQRGKMQKIITDFHKAIPQNMGKGKEAMDKLESSMNLKAKALLDAKQYESFITTMKKLKPKGPPPGGNHVPKR